MAILNHLKTCRNLNISVDGGKLTKKKFFSVHVTTPTYQSFCLELDDVARLSHDYLSQYDAVLTPRFEISVLLQLAGTALAALYLTMLGIRVRHG